MGLVIKESIKSTITTFSGALLGLITMIFSLKIFSQEEYGFYQSILKISAILGYFFILGFDYTLMILGQRFPDDSPKRSAFLRYSLFIPLVLFIITVIPYLLSKDIIISHIDSQDIQYYNDYFYYFPAITFIYLILYWFMGFLRSKNKSTAAYFLHDIIVRVGNIISILLFAFDVINFKGFIIGLLTSLLIPAVWALKISRREKGFIMRKNVPLTSQEKKHVLEFSFFHMMVVIASMIIFHIDAFLFPYISSEGLKNIGVFSLSLYVISVLRMPLRVVGLNAIPTLTNYYDQNNQSKLQELFGRSSLNLQLLGSLMCVIIIVNIQDMQWILNSWKTGYDFFEKIIPILIIGVWIELSLGLNFEMMGVSRYYRYTFWISCVYLAVTIPLFILLGQEWGLTGMAWAFTISLIIFSLTKSIFVTLKMGLTPINKDSLKVLALSLFCLPLYFFPTVIHPFFSICVYSSIIIVLFSVISLKWNIGEDVSHLYNKAKSRFIKK